MASDESTAMVFSMQEEDEHEDTDDGCYYDNDQHHQNQHNKTLSRLSVCTSYDADDDSGDDGNMTCHDVGISMSSLSIEEEDDADEELSEKYAGKGGGGGERLLDLVSSDSDKEPSCYSLPATPPRRRRRNYPGGGSAVNNSISGGKAYASENEAQKGNRCKARRHRRVKRENFLTEGSKRRDCGVNSVSGEESDHGGSGGGGVVVITRPKGGERALCMDLEEVKACRDLGLELETGRVSFSTGSTLDTSSGGNSPIANWRISSPGDDPRDVKARLKIWAQAVALASASPHSY